MEVQENSNQDQDGLAENVLSDTGMPEGSADEINESHEADGSANSNSSGGVAGDPVWMQKRLKQQKRAHEREMREMREHMAQMQQMQAMNNPYQQNINQANNPYGAPQSGGVDEQIHKAVSYALQHKEMEERKAKELENQEYINNMYQEFDKHLDDMNDKYDDFEDVVRSPKAHFSHAMKAFAMSAFPQKGDVTAGDVLYELGKNPENLDRISKLHPAKQANEMNTLYRSLISRDKKSTAPSKNFLGSIKSNPVSNSHSINDKTSVSEIRRRMKAGWK